MYYYYVFVVLVSIISFMVASDYFISSNVLYGFFQIVFCTYFPKKEFNGVVAKQHVIARLIFLKAWIDKIPMGNTLLVFLLS